ncbi:Nramp family divalent metal transporter [Bacillus daqingensis]|uniref:Nramp family divalent metal transporter n=1 Tax=Bacillus daqingensis TaxID=872396 RepID=A0ABV9NS49_9BACI
MIIEAQKRMTDVLVEQQAANEAPLTMKERLASLGPSAIVAACIIGPGTVTTVSVAGASYGFQVMWVLVLACIAAYYFQRPVVKFTLQTGMSAMDGIRVYLGKKVSIPVYVALLLGAVAFQAGNFIGAALALNFFLPAVSIVGWVSILAFMALIIAWVGVYRLIENINRVIIGTMVGAFVLTVFVAGPSITDVATTGFSFNVPEANYWLILALIATTLPPNTALGLSAFIKRKYENNTTLSTEKKMQLSYFDLRTNLTIAAVIAVSILICAGSTIYLTGAEITGAGDMAYQLTPLLGQYAGVLFALGLFAAGFSSGLFNITVQPHLFGQATGTTESVKALPNRIMITIAAVLPIVVVFFFGGAPVEMIMTAQALNGLLLPIVVGAIWWLCTRRKELGDKANSLRENIAYGAVMLLVCGLAIRVYLDLFGII